MIHNIYEDTREEGERLQKVWLASGGSFGGLLRFVPPLSLSSQTYSDAILQLVAAAGGLSQPGGQDLELDQPGDGGCWHLVVTPVKSQQNTRPGAGWAFFLSPSEMGRNCQSSI